MSNIQRLLRYVRDCSLDEESKDELLLLIIEMYYSIQEVEGEDDESRVPTRERTENKNEVS